MSAEQSRLAKLQEENQLRETREAKRFSQKNGKAVGSQRLNFYTQSPEIFFLNYCYLNEQDCQNKEDDEDIPSEDGMYC